MKKNGLIKFAEIGLLLGITAGSVFGFSQAVKGRSASEDRYNEMCSSDAVTTYIQDDLDELNLKYDVFSDSDTSAKEFKEYRKEVKNLRENGASEIYGEEFDKIKHDIDIDSIVSLSFAGLGTFLGLTLLLIEAGLKSTSFVDFIKNYKGEVFDDKFISNIDRGLEKKVNAVKKNFALATIYQHGNMVSFKVSERYKFNDVCFVYNIDPAKLNLKQDVDYFSCDLPDSMEDDDKKYLLDLVRKEKPAFIGNEQDAHDYLFNSSSQQEDLEEEKE